MTILISKLREISVFIYLLVFLLLFNLYFNQNYSWPGVSLIVRVYLFVFFFYLVFIFASLEINELRSSYSEKYGNKGNLILFIETRIIPFLIIYLITIIFTLIDYIRSDNWPWNPVLSLLNGRYSNNVIYSMLFLMVLKLKKKPIVIMLLFPILLWGFFLFDRTIYSVAGNGLLISGVKIFKIFLVCIFLFSEFFKNRYKNIIYSAIFSVLFLLSTISIFALLFKYSPEGSYRQKESGINLIKMGVIYPLERLKKTVINKSDYSLFNNLLSVSNQYQIEIKYSQTEWEQILFRSDVKTADIISGYLMNKKINFPYKKIIAYAEKKSKGNTPGIESAENFIKISSKFFIGHEREFIDELKSSNKIFKVWGIRILSENKTLESIPLLLNFTADLDEAISDSAYKALTVITGMNPAAVLDKKKNDPDTLEIFKKYYLQNSGRPK